MTTSVYSEEASEALSCLGCSSGAGCCADGGVQSFTGKQAKRLITFITLSRSISTAMQFKNTRLYIKQTIKLGLSRDKPEKTAYYGAMSAVIIKN